MEREIEPRSPSEAGSRILQWTGFLILLLGLVLRLAQLDFQPLWWDEGYSVWFATHPLGQMAALTAEDIHPPLYYALLHGWIQLFGPGPSALRLLSVLFGALAIAAVYLAGRQLTGNPRLALLAAFLLAINPFHVFYSQEIRMYGLVALLSTGVLVVAWRVLMYDGRWTMDDGRRSYVVHRTSYILYIALTSLALYTQYYAAFLPLGLTLYAAWRWRRDLRALARWLMAQAVVALLYLPWILYATPKLIPYISQKVIADADRPLGPLMYTAKHLAAFLVGHLEGALHPWWPAALLLLLPLGLGWWLIAAQRMASGESANQRISEWRISESANQRINESANGESPTNAHTLPSPHSRFDIPHSTFDIPHSTFHIRHSTFHIRHSTFTFLATVILTALILGWLISLRAPFFPERGERLLILALPAFVLLMALSLEALWQRWRTIGYVTLGGLIAVSAASLAAFYTVPRYADDDYRPLIAQTVQQGLPEDVVYCVYPWQVGYWRAYGVASGPTAVLTPQTEWGSAVATFLDVTLARGRVWFPAHLALGAILESRVESHLAENGLLFFNRWYGPNTRLSAWTNAAIHPTDFAKADADLRFALPQGGRLTLRGVSGLTAATPAANSVTPVELIWEADERPPVLAASIRLTDDLGQIWAQHDYEPVGRIANFGSGISDLISATTQQFAIRNPQSAIYRAADRLGLLIPVGTPPGRYHVELVLQTKGSARPLDVFAADGKSLGTAARLYDLDVTPADRPLGPERLPIAVHRAVDMGDGLRFLGYSADARPYIPGELRRVNLFWQATAPPKAEYFAFVQMLGRDGVPVALWEAPAGAAYPTSAWEPGTLMRTQAALRVPPSVPDGRYRLIAGLFRAEDKTRLRTASGADYILLGDVAVKGRPHRMTPPEAGHPADVTFGGLARLIGYDLALPADDIAPGTSFELTLHWQALAASDRPYAVFVHLVDEAGTIRGYGDAEPGNGAFPTPGWLSGEYLADVHTVSVAADTLSGMYRLAVGFYDPASGERLKTPEGGDEVVLEKLIKVR